MPKLTHHFKQSAAKYHATYSPATIEVDWDAYTKNPGNPDETARAVHIYTERLVLQSATLKDAENARKYVWGDPEVMKLYFNGIPQDKEAVGKTMIMWDGRLKAQNPFSGFTISTKEHDEFVGNIVLSGASEKESAELAYLSTKHVHNKGYGKEYFGAVVFDWGAYIIASDKNFKLPNGQDFKNIVATSRTDNIPSSKILQDTLGFTLYKTEEKFGAERHHYEMKVVEEMGAVEDVFTAEM